ncbi:MAG: 3-methyl-2-oxobutanoate hydroxymethyltransferase [Candidatus Nanopelagicales bacterium]
MSAVTPASPSAAANTTPTSSSTSEPTLYGKPPSSGPVRRITVNDLSQAKMRGEKWPMITCYDALTAGLFDESGVPVLLVGDSAANVVLGHDSTLPITVDELIMLTAAVVRGSKRAMVVADLPFGSYQASPEQALHTASRFLKESGAHAVKLEGGARVLPQVEALVSAGIPVMGHLGLTPQSVHTMGGYRVQGRGEAGQILMQDAKALQHAGAFSLVMELVPTELATTVTKSLAIPTIGIGAGAGTDAQVLVWQDMAGLTPGKPPKFVKQYADLRSTLGDAVTTWADEVRLGKYPSQEHTYQ